MRRTRPESRDVTPDTRYNKEFIQRFVNRFMKNGKKSVAISIMYDALDIIKERTGQNPVEIMENALKNVGPLMEVRPRRVGGSTYQVPMEVPNARREALAMRWLIAAAQGRTGKSFAEKLSGELLDASNNQGNAIRKREEVHKMAEANRAFSHYRL